LRGIRCEAQATRPKLRGTRRGCEAGNMCTDVHGEDNRRRCYVAEAARHKVRGIGCEAKNCEAQCTRYKWRGTGCVASDILPACTAKAIAVGDSGVGSGGAPEGTSGKSGAGSLDGRPGLAAVRAQGRGKSQDTPRRTRGKEGRGRPRGGEGSDVRGERCKLRGKSCEARV